MMGLLKCRDKLNSSGFAYTHFLFLANYKTIIFQHVNELYKFVITKRVHTLTSII